MAIGMLGGCSCCEAGCCMYDASQPNEIQSGELPETIRLRNFNNTAYISLSVSGTSYGDTTNGVIFESGTWAIYRNGNRITRTCLFTQADYESSTGLIKDDFPSSLSWPGVEQEFILTRDSLCLWSTGETNCQEGSIVGPCIFILYVGYNSDICQGYGDYSPIGPIWWVALYYGSELHKLENAKSPRGNYVGPSFSICEQGPQPSNFNFNVS